MPRLNPRRHTQRDEVEDNVIDDQWQEKFTKCDGGDSESAPYAEKCEAKMVAPEWNMHCGKKSGA